MYIASQPTISTAVLKRQVVVTENHGGHCGGTCQACGAGGWITGRYGLPHHVSESGSHLRHKKSCPLNPYLTNHGTWRTTRAAKPKAKTKKVARKRAKRRLR